MDKKPIVFVVMPFNEDFSALFNHLKEEFENKFVFTNAGDLDNQQNILKDIVEGIETASIVIADLTNLNPNVFYELGLAHAMNKKTIIITQDLSELPFDLKSYRAIEYSLQFNKLPKLVTELEKLLPGAIDGTVKFGNPVSDYSSGSFFIEKTNNTVSIDNPSSDEGEVQEVEGSKGFIDFIADIEENNVLINSELEGISSDMNEMSESVEYSVQEINRVKSQSGKGNNTASFVRSVCRKLSLSVEAFSNTFSERTTKIEEYWANVENSYLSLLEDKHIRTDNNIAALKQNIPELEGLLEVIDNTDESMGGFKNSMEDCLGLERKLTQAITGLIAQTENYLSFTERMSSSIERICTRTEMVIDEFNNNNTTIE